MALIACVECGHAVGRSAPTCPQCGCPDPATAPTILAAAPHAAKAAASDIDCAPPVQGTASAYCTHCGKARPTLAKFCPACGHAAQSTSPGSAATEFAPALLRAPDGMADARMLDRIASYERTSAIVWLVFGILQIVSVVAVIAGIWNILAAVSRFKLSPMIRARDPQIPGIYEGIGQLIVIGVINLLVGGVIGVVFVGFDFYVRSLVLENRHLFANSASPAVAQPL